MKRVTLSVHKGETVPLEMQMNDLALKRPFETGSLLEKWSRELVCNCALRRLLEFALKSLPAGNKQRRWTAARSGR